MKGFLIDTNVVSEFVKPDPEEAVVRWFHRLDPPLPYTSVVTLGEIRLGIEDLPSGSRRTRLERWLEDVVPPWFGDNILPVTHAVSDDWGRIATKAKKQGIALTTTDGLILATARVHDLQLVTRNVKDFAWSGLGIVNPWNQSSSR